MHKFELVKKTRIDETIECVERRCDICGTKLRHRKRMGARDVTIGGGFQRTTEDCREVYDNRPGRYMHGQSLLCPRHSEMVEEFIMELSAQHHGAWGGMVITDDIDGYPWEVERQRFVDAGGLNEEDDE